MLRSEMNAGVRKPHWLTRRLPTEPEYENTKALLGKANICTVCQEAKCPNLWECFSSRTATFLIMGSRCTRRCPFCAVAYGPSSPPDPEEPVRVAKAARDMKLQYVVITSVTRDDLPDGGAAYFSQTVREIRKRIPGVCVEVLIPDFYGNKEALLTVLDARPDVLNHNVETVSRLYPIVRPGALYKRSLELLEQVKKHNSDIPIKSGLMLGLGELPEEVRETLRDLFNAGCRILTLGQYLQPTKEHLPVERFVPPQEFEYWKRESLKLGFSEVASGPFIRSSYHAKRLYNALRK